MNEKINPSRYLLAFVLCHLFLLFLHVQISQSSVKDFCLLPLDSDDQRKDRKQWVKRGDGNKK